MAKNPIVIIEDDQDDQEILISVFKEMNISRPLIFFDSCEDVIPYLLTEPVQPFLILSDVNLPVMDGIILRTKICDNEYLKEKSIPFVFFTTTATKEAIKQAYDMTVQGYFEKPSSIKDLKIMLQVILDYWALCKHPNSL